mmetsp:Transcript_35458/g.111591  ORF Transcript_35458/g.111591 Transcript_35458/m.111591 type:complete len:214 (-) Transcript_35458:1896-2537(-)
MWRQCLPVPSEPGRSCPHDMQCTTEPAARFLRPFCCSLRYICMSLRDTFLSKRPWRFRSSSSFCGWRSCISCMLSWRSSRRAMVVSMSSSATLDASFDSSRSTMYAILAASLARRSSVVSSMSACTPAMWSLSLSMAALARLSSIAIRKTSSWSDSAVLKACATCRAISACFSASSAADRFGTTGSGIRCGYGNRFTFIMASATAVSAVCISC